MLKIIVIRVKSQSETRIFVYADCILIWTIWVDENKSTGVD